MKRLVLILAPIILAVGCKQRVIYQPQEVKVPVIVKAPKPNIPPKPELPVINPDDSPDVKCKKLLKAIVILMEYSDALGELLKAYE